MEINNAYRLIVDKLSIWMKGFIKMIPNIAVAAVILVLGFFLAKLLKSLAEKVIRKISHNVMLNNLLSSLVYIFLLGIVLFTALSVLQLDKAVTTILAGAGIAGLALAFAFQDIAANFMAGILISFRRPIRIGDVVTIKSYMGKVKEINLRDTLIQTFQGHMVIIPNKEVFQNPIENFSTYGKRRMDLVVGVSYGEDLEKVKSITLEAVKDVEGLTTDDKTSLFFQEFADSSINYVIRLWVNSPEQPDYLNVQSQAVMKIKKAYDENGIMIPFPIRTLDFGIKGGVTLTQTPVTIKGNGAES